MLRVYEEHPEFNRFTRFDSEAGRLIEISEEEFEGYLPSGTNLAALRATRFQRVEGRGATLFVGETPSTHTRFPRRVYFQITRRCNLGCSFCFMRAGSAGAHVPTQAIRRLADLMGHYGLMEVRLTGGEPTMHPDFFTILEYFRENGVYVSVSTNGVVDRSCLERLAEQPNLWVICSLDGNRETHNAYRPDTFDKILSNLDYLKKRNPTIRLRLTTVLTKRNKDQMGDLARICRSLDAESLTVIPLRPEVRECSAREEMVTAPEFRAVIEKLVEAKRQHGIKFTTTLETDFAKHVYGDPVFTKRSSCAAGREGTNLDYDARLQRFIVYGCGYSPAANLDADPSIRAPFLAGTFSPTDPEAFLRIWQDESAWTIFRDLSIKSDECMHCGYFARKQCVGSCPIQNVDYSALDAGKDALDQLREQIRLTGEWYCYKRVLGEEPRMEADGGR